MKNKLYLHIKYCLSEIYISEFYKKTKYLKIYVSTVFFAVCFVIEIVFVTYLSIYMYVNTQFFSVSHIKFQFFTTIQLKFISKMFFVMKYSNIPKNKNIVKIFSYFLYY